LDFLQVDVFAEAPYRGNQLAVFPDVGDVSARQMQAIASEMNLSETTFVTESDPESYSVRIFTPREELGFAGHPTIGTAWVLRGLGRITGDEVTQRSKGGETPVRFEGGRAYFERAGSSEQDYERRDPEIDGQLARGLGIEKNEIGLDARELGRSGFMRPAFSDAGYRHLIVPVRSLDALARAWANPSRLPDTSPGGIYCFTATAAGYVQARGFFPGLGVAEDPGTGSAAADLGVYLADRIGDIRFEITQGVEMGRPSRILVNAHRHLVEVGGATHLVFEGKLIELPAAP
jgi:trans-2,3-dihydro-3-hydroxyanthranilate isomerase